MSEQAAITRWSSRKFWAAMVWQFIFTALLWAGKMPIEFYEKLTWLTLGGYFASNLVNKYMDRKR